jgi:hypothetical protein
VAAVLVSTLAATALCRVFAHLPPKIEGRPLLLQVELRLPIGSDRPAETMLEELYVDFLVMVPWGFATADRVNLDPTQARTEGNRVIVPGSMPLFTARGRRVLTFNIKGKPLWEQFEIPLPAHPGREQLEWSGWWPTTTEAGQPWPESKLSCRFRVAKIEPTIAAPNPVRPAPDKFAEAKAELESTPADTPLTAYLKFTRFEAPEGIKPLALARMAVKPTFAAEIKALVLADDASTAAEVLRLVPQAATASLELQRAVAAAGADIAERNRRVNATPQKDDLDYLGAADVSTRFIPWFMAVTKLRAQDGGDFIPVLRTILELSRERKDSIAMQQDVCRVASHALHEWAGVTPLPTDPTPR